MHCFSNIVSCQCFSRGDMVRQLVARLWRKSVAKSKNLVTHEANRDDPGFGSGEIQQEGTVAVGPRRQHRRPACPYGRPYQIQLPDKLIPRGNELGVSFSELCEQNFECPKG
jgi:hypothetical protein